ncbi:chromosomal replication initiator protein DnaA [Candidatus Peregrinibacteria bacterium]|nr:chromosomal replication initiator protein DnaA [Candidatus Peregrinibacteria bacterium]
MDHLEFWKQVLLSIEPKLKRSNFVTWFQDTAILDVNDTTVAVGVPNPFAKDWLQKKYHQFIIDAIKSIRPQIESIEYVVMSSLKAGQDERAVNIQTLVEKPVKSIRKLPNKSVMRVTHDGVQSKFLNERYRLENFVVGPDNRLAHAACSAVCSRPGSEYNPLFIYGGVGLGKTHLLQATGNAILKRFPESVVVYITAERFMNEIVEAIGRRNTKQFKDRYRQVDCLIIDDIQFLGNKEMTQEEFFHTFNELYDNNKQIIISSDRPPRELKGVQDRLMSRFGMGMIVDVQFPDYETRLAILHAKCPEHNAIIPAEVLEFIAFNVHHSIRELEGVLLQAIAQAQLENSTPTVRSVGLLLKKLSKDEPVAGFDEQAAHRSIARAPEDVIEIVADYFKITKSDLIGESRRKEIMLPRQISMYLIRHELGRSYENIGLDFGNRSHTTVLHGCEMIIKKLRTSTTLVRDMNALKKEMGL